MERDLADALPGRPHEAEVTPPDESMSLSHAVGFGDIHERRDRWIARVVEQRLDDASSSTSMFVPLGRPDEVTRVTGLLPGLIRLSARSRGMLRLPVREVWLAPGNNRVRLELDAGRTISGTVHNADGPVRGLTLSLSDVATGDDIGSPVTDDDGVFTCTGLRATTRIRAGSVNHVDVVVDPAASTDGLVVMLPDDLLVLTGRTLDGETPQRMDVEVETVHGERPVASTSSTVGGWYAVAGLPVDTALRVTGQLSGGRRFPPRRAPQTRTVTLDGTRSTTALDLPIVDVVNVRGVLRQPDGHPLPAGTRLRIGRRRHSAWSIEDGGEFEMPMTGPEEVEAFEQNEHHVVRGHWTGWIDPSKPGPLDITLRRCITQTVNVRDTNAGVPEGCSVWLHGPGGYRDSHEPGPTGTVVFDANPPMGRYDLVVVRRIDGRELRSESIVFGPVDRLRPIELVVDAPPLQRVRGRIVDTAGNGVSAGLTLYPSEGADGWHLATTHSADDGSFAFDGIPDGHYTLWATTSERELFANGCDVDVRAGQPVDVQWQAGPTIPGCRVLQVVADGAAAAAGMKVGDIIVGVGLEEMWPVSSRWALRHRMQQLLRGVLHTPVTMRLTVWRAGSTSAMGLPLTITSVDETGFVAE
ncbi:MAG: carboxypeptidase-like regulatory domain-containing protein [Planctomycetota bacterium]